MKSNQQKASITVYLALTFVIMLSFLLTLVEGARENAIRMKLECAMELSLYSVFAEYNREMLKQYDLFFIDSSYGQGQGSIENVEAHLKGYLEDNFQTQTSAGLVKNLLSMYTEEVEIGDYALATDEKGKVLKRQAVAYMKDYYGISYLSQIEEQLNTMKDNELLSRDVTRERQANQSAIDSVEIPPRKVREDEWEEVKLDNPADAVNAGRGILSFVIPGDQEISTAAVNPENYVSHREVKKGSGIGKRDDLGVGDELIFNEYLMQKYGNYTEQKENSLLSYQLEYVIAGQSNDIENLKKIVNRLLLLRETANVVYLFSDSAKMAEAEALALSVTSAIAMPELAELVKISLLFAWAYAESVYDVKSLLKGGKIPILKTEETWHFSLSGMMDYASDQTVSDQNAEGISYREYLRLFLAVMDTEEKTGRAMDIMEMDIRPTSGNSQFRIDCCLDYLNADVFAASAFGYSHEIQREYYYQ